MWVFLCDQRHNDGNGDNNNDDYDYDDDDDERVKSFATMLYVIPLKFKLVYTCDVAVSFLFLAKTGRMICFFSSLARLFNRMFSYFIQTKPMRKVTLNKINTAQTQESNL